MNPFKILTFALLTLAAAPVHAQVCDNCGIPLAIDAQAGGVSYTSAGPIEVEAITKEMAIPRGYRMARIRHAPRYVCSEYAVADTFEIRPIKVKRVRATVTKARVKTLTDIWEATQ